MVLFDKISFSFKEAIIKKKFHETRFYESVDKKPLLSFIAKLTKKEFGRQRVNWNV